MALNILVVGGAGYIGSHMVKRLGAAGAEVVTLDNLVSGHRDAVLGGEFVHGDIADRGLLERLFASRRFDAVMHFASHIEVGESVRQPAKYYRNNVANTLTLLEAMIAAKVERFIFSSTAAIFGKPEYTPIDEHHPRAPINPYGRTKNMIEQVLADLDHAHGLRAVCLRYFNAAGADPTGVLGERHDPESHLIPLTLQAASGRRPSIAVFGTDYDTPDGTCIRDYVHVQDLADAHVLAVEALLSGQRRDGTFNVGLGHGFSVKEVLDTVDEVVGTPLNRELAPRRAGDPPRLVADATRIREELGFKPQFTDLKDIVQTAWNWHKGHPHDFKK